MRQIYLFLSLKLKLQSDVLFIAVVSRAMIYKMRLKLNHQSRVKHYYLHQVCIINNKDLVVLQASFILCRIVMNRNERLLC